MIQNSRIALLSIHSEHADQIFNGQKRVELRKSFNSNIQLVFLYETAPRSAVTGFFFVESSEKHTAGLAIAMATSSGIPRERAEAYFAKSPSGWIVRIGPAVRFDSAITFDTLRGLNHYFTVPQAFSYLPSFEALTQKLIDVAASALSARLSLRPIPPLHEAKVAELIISNVAVGYEDIDSDFADQVSNPKNGSKAAFSTSAKMFLAVYCSDVVLGYVTITMKHHGAWKTGPTILLPEYQGIGVGLAVRQVIEKYCSENGARAIYCTCPSNSPNVISYLLRSGMQFQARLRSHLARNRDELVFRKALKPELQQSRLEDVYVNDIKVVAVKRISFVDKQSKKLIERFIELLPDWYFSAHNRLNKGIVSGLKAFEKGHYQYSEKPKELYAGRDRSGRIRVAALLTHKRSSMIKINLVSDTTSLDSISLLLDAVLADHVECRRFYATLPATKLVALAAMIRSGFEVEGMLSNPFGDGRDHLCFGKVSAASTVVSS